MKAFAWKNVKRSRFYAMARDIKWRMENYESEEERRRFRVVHLVPQDPAKGCALLSRINRAFFLKPGEAIPATHQNVWEAYQMARILLDLGFCVDVIDFENNSFLPKKHYSIFIDSRGNMERIAPFLNKDCVKVFHAVTAHPLYQNTAELERLLALQRRRGVTLRPRRQMDLNHGITHADCAVVLGNDFTLGTYRYAKKPMFRVPFATPHLYSWPDSKDFHSCRRQFLFFAGEGMVHKGLDLVLEAFAAMPEFSLVVCGPVEKDSDFVAAYRRELYQTENIHLVGWVDVASQTFLDIANSCIALIHPSCSESGCASVIGGMHAALIPIASYESSVDISPGFGLLLRDCSVGQIQDGVRSIASLDGQALRAMARNAWCEAREKHSPANFIHEYRRVILQALKPPRIESEPNIAQVAMK